MKNFKLIFALSLLALTFCIEQIPLMAVAPPGGAGAPFSTSCFNPSVSGFILRSQCTDANGNARNSSVNFANCIKNYDGNLSQFTGATEELFTRRCSTDGFNLTCECQQPTGGWAPCSISLDNVFTVNNGQLSC